MSEHKKIAFDCSTRGFEPEELYSALQQAGFTTFGFYGTFIHTDIRPDRRWSTPGGRVTWAEVV